MYEIHKASLALISDYTKDQYEIIRPTVSEYLRNMYEIHRASILLLSDYFKGLYETTFPVLSSAPVITAVKILLITTSLIAMVLILKQEAKAGGLDGMSSITTSNKNSYWNKNKKRSAEGKRIKWTRFLFIMFVIEVLFLYIYS